MLTLLTEPVKPLAFLFSNMTSDVLNIVLEAITQTLQEIASSLMSAMMASTQITEPLNV